MIILCCAYKDKGKIKKQLQKHKKIPACATVHIDQMKERGKSNDKKNNTYRRR